MAILVTGGASYIGSHTCVELAGRGGHCLLDNFSNAKPQVISRIKLGGKDFPLYAVDILHREGLEKSSPGKISRR